jgi:SAM-dependent methyltransferase
LSGILTPPRRRGREILDDPAVDPELMKRGMRDVERANALFGGRRAAIIELLPALRELRGAGRMLDVGTGRGDIPAAAKGAASQIGVDLWTVGIDLSQPLVSAHRSSNDAVVRGDALNLPFSDHSVDVVMASQVLHHFTADGAIAVVREMNRVARRRVVISDLRRNLLAAAGLWLGSYPLRFHPVSRHDGVLSVMRGFVPDELSEIIEIATGHRPRVRRRLGFRLTASWIPTQ